METTADEYVERQPERRKGWLFCQSVCKPVSDALDTIRAVIDKRFMWTISLLITLALGSATMVYKAFQIESHVAVISEKVMALDAREQGHSRDMERRYFMLEKRIRELEKLK